MRPLSGVFPAIDYPALLVGLNQPDDAAVYRFAGDWAVVSTVDFFPPVVDDPYAFGAIAAANALSDVYAMGGEPLFAINLVAFPDGLGLDLLTEILRGGAETVRESGAVIAGGHTVTDKEPKYGLAVTGKVHREKIITKGGSKPGDKLILTKPLGVGVVTTALKQGKARTEDVTAAIASMTRLNRDASHLAQRYGVHAMTDVTGYGLLGHGHEMAHLSGVDFKINYQTIAWLPGAQWYGQQGIFPGGMGRNRDYFEQWTYFDQGIDESAKNLLFDPETSGGLLMAVHPEDAEDLRADLQVVGDEANIIGEVTPGSGKVMIFS